MIQLRLEVGQPTDDVMEIEDEPATEVRLWPLHFYIDDNSDPVLSLELALEREQDEEGLYPAFAFSALDEEQDEALSIILALQDYDSDDEDGGDWIDESMQEAIESLSDDELELYGMLGDFIDFAQGALEEQSLSPGSVIRYDELEFEDDDEDDDEDEDDDD